MKFNLGQYRKVIGGPTFIKDTYQVQVDPEPVEETPKQEETPQVEVKMSGEPSLEPVIKELTPKEDDTIRPEQVEKKPTPKRTRAKRKRSGSSSQGN